MGRHPPKESPVRIFRLTAVAIGAAALVAPAAASAATPIKVSEKEFSISGMPKTLKHGVKYTITLTNKGTYPHDLLIDGKKVHDVGIHNAHAVAPGSHASFSVTFPTAGSYEFYCAIKGHAAKGMKGKVKVT
jgi:uncharacterized cupredoxin-like copper-binding protein